MYNAISVEPTNLDQNNEQLASADPTLFILSVLNQFSILNVSTKYGSVPKGSVLNKQQKLKEDCVIHVLDGVSFPPLNFLNQTQLQIVTT